MIYVSSAAGEIYYVYDGTDLVAYNDEECTDKVYPMGNTFRVHFINSGNWDDVVMTYTGNRIMHHQHLMTIRQRCQIQITLQEKKLKRMRMVIIPSILSRQMKEQTIRLY